LRGGKETPFPFFPKGEKEGGVQTKKKPLPSPLHLGEGEGERGGTEKGKRKAIFLLEERGEIGGKKSA